MFDDLLITDTAIKRLERLRERQPHGLILAGAGSIPMDAARKLTARLLDITEGQLDKYPYVRIIRKEKDASSVSVEQIQSLRPFLALKTITAASSPSDAPGRHSIKRVIIIANAETMLHEAQNALLKMLEEPPADTCIMLAAAELTRLLPTIISRAAAIHLPLPDLAKIQTRLKDTREPAAISKAFHLSGGNAELFIELLDADAGNPWLQSAELAKQLLAGTLLQRLMLIDGISKDQAGAQRLLSVVKQIAHAKLRSRLSTEQSQAWRRRMLLVQKAQQALSNHAQTKLTLTHVALEL